MKMPRELNSSDHRRMSMHKTRGFTYGLGPHGAPPVPDGLGGAAGPEGVGGLGITLITGGATPLGFGTGTTDGATGALDLSSAGRAVARLVVC